MSYDEKRIPAFAGMTGYFHRNDRQLKKITHGVIFIKIAKHGIPEKQITVDITASMCNYFLSEEFSARQFINSPRKNQGC
jgi:hypothetical protein